jgi:hypothetical protein
MRGSGIHLSRRWIALLIVSAAALVLAPAAGAAAFTNGDVFVSVGGGHVEEFTPGGTLVQTLDTTTGGFTTGSAFDQAGNFYVTDFTTTTVSKFDPTGNLVGTFGSGYPGSPESILFDNAGNAFVGQPGAPSIEEFDASGNPVTTFSVASGDGGNGGTDWIDLAADSCTMHYTDEGTGVKSFDVCTNTQGPDFATGLPGPNAYAHRILPGGGELVADSDRVVRLDSSGAVVQTYMFPGETGLFALNLDPGGTSFWTADFGTADVLHVDIASGTVLGQFNTGTGSNSVFGLAVKGEITAAQDPKIAATGAAALQGTTGQPVSGTVATFSDPDTTATAGEYSASIGWGDGSTSAGTVSGGGGSFSVSDAHTYANAGSYTITVTISDLSDSSNTATVTDQANIAPASAPPQTGRPTIVGGSPVNKTSSRATLVGTVAPDGLATTYHFEYGLDSRYRIQPTSGVVYDQRTPDQVLAATSPAAAVTASATELVPNALYHARLVATNNAGTTFAPDQTFSTAKDLKTPPEPVLGKSFDGSLVSGVVLVKPPAHASARTFGGRRVRVTLPPKNHGFFPLTEPLSLPAGTKVDALRGSLRLLTATAQKGRTYNGVFGSGLFSIRQDARGATKALTTLALLEGAFAGAPTYSSCRAKAGKPVLRARAASLSSKVLQTLRARVHGRFRTRGRYSASTVRGTGWDMSDRCDGTLTVVRRGTVEVSDFVRHVTVVVPAGHRYFARAAKPAHK